MESFLINLHFVHGFLGFSFDWDEFKEVFKSFNCKFHSITDYNLNSCNSDISFFNNWATNFNNSILKNQNKYQKNILIGYSLGGRLALHCLCKNNPFDAAIIISTNPGLISPVEKQTRIINDNMWANRFLNEKWEDVINAWNSQNVFSSRIKVNLIREEKYFNKHKIANILNQFSLGKQENLREKIKLLQIPILWIAGEKDIKFSLIANEMAKLNSKIECKIFKNAGHRVPWEKTFEFTEKCLKFFEK
jgi:2-succinyl-6-hydroxy-2,4-cyclohexadiene-1-carboxylate synthase